MIQIDIEMPKCCDVCFALDEHGDYPFCLISHDQRGYTFNTRENRMPTCPLKEVKKQESLEKLPCVCGCKKREWWYSLEGDFFKCMKCGRTSRPGKTEKEAIKNWNLMMETEKEKIIKMAEYSKGDGDEVH